MGCSLQWFSEKKFQKCETKDQLIREMVKTFTIYFNYCILHKLQNLLTELKTLPLDNFTEKTGCYFKCEKFKEIFVSMTDDYK